MTTARKKKVKEPIKRSYYEGTLGDVYSHFDIMFGLEEAQELDAYNPGEYQHRVHSFIRRSLKNGALVKLGEDKYLIDEGEGL